MNGVKIAENIEKKCQEKKISVHKMTKGCSLGGSIISDMKGQRSKNPKINTLIKICDYLDCELKDILE